MAKEKKVRVAGGRKTSKKQLTDEEKKAGKDRLDKAVKEHVEKQEKEKEEERAQQLLDGSFALQKLIEDKAAKIASKIMDDKAEAIQKKIKEARKGRPSSGMREYEKFSCEKLIAIFGGWFTLSYLFTVQNDDKEHTTTDFYVCSQDISLMRANERPKVNRVIKQQFGKTVYGFAIIAPISAFE